MNIRSLKKVLCAFDDFSMLFSWTRRHMKFLFAIRLFPWSYWVEKFLLWWQNNSRSKQMWEATHWAGVNLMDIIEPSFHFLRFQIKLNLISSHFGSRNMKSEFLATHDFFHWWKIWNHNIGFIPIRKPHTHTQLSNTQILLSFIIIRKWIFDLLFERGWPSSAWLNSCGKEVTPK